MIIQATRRSPAFFKRRTLRRRLARIFTGRRMLEAAWAAGAVLVWGGLCLFLLLAGGAQ